MLNEKVQLSVDEYNSLRKEVVQRVSIINSQASSALGIILTTWGSGFALLGIQVASHTTLSGVPRIGLALSQIAAFAVSLAMLLPMAAKSGENLKQISSIASYIKVFYDYHSQHITDGNAEKQIITLWEIADGLINTATTPKEGTRIKQRLINSEYSILAVASLLFIVCSVAINRDLLSLRPYRIALIVSALFSAFAIYLIVSFSNIKTNIMEQSILYTKKYLIYATEIGLIPKENREKAWKELNPRNTISCEEYDWDS